MAENKIIEGLRAAIGHAPSLVAFHEALARARTDLASVEPGSEMAKLAERLSPGGKLRLSLGDQPSTPEELAAIINRSMDEIESGAIKGYDTFAEAEAASRHNGRCHVGACLFPDRCGAGVCHAGRAGY